MDTENQGGGTLPRVAKLQLYPQLTILAVILSFGHAMAELETEGCVMQDGN